MEEKQADDSGQMHIMSNGVSLRNCLSHCEMAKELTNNHESTGVLGMPQEPAGRQAPLNLGKKKINADICRLLCITPPLSV